jgi:hypothetical protein
MHVPADRKQWDTSPVREIPYALFVTNRSDDISPMDALGFTDRYSDRWDIEIEYKMITPLIHYRLERLPDAVLLIRIFVPALQYVARD